MKLPPSPLAVAFRHIKPGWRRYLDFVELAARAGHLEMQRVMDAYASLPKREQAKVLPEQLCDMAGVKPETLFGAVCEQLWAQSRMECNVLAAIHMPRIMETTMKQAATPKGTKDREMVHKHTGFVPTPKPAPGASIFINAASGPHKPAVLTSPEVDFLEAEKVRVLELPAASPGGERVDS